MAMIKEQQAKAAKQREQLINNETKAAPVQKETPRQEQPQPKEEETPQPPAIIDGYIIEDIDISHLWNKDEAPEEEQVTPAPALLNFDMPKSQAANTPRLEIVKYTELSFLVKGEDTYLIREELKGLGGIYRAKWNGHNNAWMFAEKKPKKF
jgi:sRNA-binding protein